MGLHQPTFLIALHTPMLRKEAYRNNFMYVGGKLWNNFPKFVQNSTNADSFKRD